ncbi:hypothetical protein T10_9010 [Trichinella papuae]|uniref:Uncharacterized protein n=1 Tax=Trichinella papuae TaxID=268474 RepID=A0A0V1M2G2_9BILA|nr:hypothetical protein T10_9010 [Trichinella papuae]
MEKKGRNMLLEDRRKRENDREDFLEENTLITEKKRTLLVGGKRHGRDKMKWTWLCENTVKLHKDGEGFTWENDSGLDLIGTEFLGMYGSGPDKRWLKENGTGLEKKGRSMLLENSGKLEKEGEDFWVENNWIPEKNRTLLVRGKRQGWDKMEETSLCENTVKLYKDGGEFFWENDSGPDLNGTEFLGKYTSGPDKKWQSWLWENSTKLVKVASFL